jgi:hypothetical protein
MGIEEKVIPIHKNLGSEEVLNERIDKLAGTLRNSSEIRENERIVGVIEMIIDQMENDQTLSDQEKREIIAIYRKRINSIQTKL